MSRIALLSDEVASQVAAGEVVERPASVVKELVENAVDAGARQIEVMVRRGGISLIRVVDDGCGMDRDDALLSIERHATSKIRTGADLASIRTLGFRGEALPSIASVSRFRLSTREHGALAGTELLITGGRIEHVRDGGDAPGTQIEIRSLFFNLPARRRFLRTENTEMSHVEHQLQLQAIGHPEIGFIFRTDQRLIFQLPPAASLKDRIRDLAGATIAAELLEIPASAEDDAVRLHGFLARPSVSRSTRSQQHVFVNGRAVENATINHALREGYHTTLMKGQYPITYLFLEIDPAAVDVNVHPAKREVRFREPSVVREAVVAAVQATLEGDRENWSERFKAPVVREPAAQEVAPPPAAPVTPLIPSLLERMPRVEPARAPLPEADRPGGTIADGPLSPALPETAAPVPPRSSPSPGAPSLTSFAIPGDHDETSKPFRLLGVVGNLYVVMENASGLVLVDQHAAHERILFEELRRRMEERGVTSQRLLMPVTLQLGPRDSDWVEQNIETLRRMGIGVESFGNGAWKLDSLPQFVRSSEPLQLLREIIDELRTVSSQTSKLRLGEEVIAKTVCRAAVKANDVLRGPELVRLIEDLLRCDLPYCCPHGRPTMIQLSYPELEKKFGRRT
ncbi:MAG TPA: DNA mismatch repair endonuclease MutL [Chthoniobacteraceae bacterium]|nr:DNA mismatch repair endonuclease MutL [Chthoniobacteraceae bacterium]